MSSTSRVNFSVRQNKAIERHLVFEGLSRVVNDLGLTKLIYAGFGSVWFSDFHLAHRHLRINDMHSFEADPVVAARARFNRPYRTVKVHEGFSDVKLPPLLADPALKSRPWIVWLDYDDRLDEANVNELVDLIRDLPPNSFLLTTFQTAPGRYSKLPSRHERLGEIMGREVAKPADIEVLKDPSLFSRFLGDMLDQHLLARAISQGRTGGYIPAFLIPYADGVPMVTVGGFLPSTETRLAAKGLISSADWCGRPSNPIETAPLTAREVAALQRRLPARSPLTRAAVKRMGFDLDDAQIALYEQHYQRYPAFAQIAN